MIISFTGHRPDKLYNKQGFIFSKLIEYLGKEKPEKCISGMCIGVDLLAAESCYCLNIPFIAAVPFVGQEDKWRMEDKLRYNFFLSKAAEVKIISDSGYDAWKYQVRNKWMVNNSDRLLAVYNGDMKGGTFNTIKYAKSINKPIHYIDL